MKKHCLFSLLLCAVWMLVEVLVNITFGIFGVIDESGVAGAAASKILMFVLAIAAGYYFRKKGGWDIPNRYVITLILVPVSSIYIIHNVFFMASHTDVRLIFPFVSGLLLLTVNYVVFEVYEWFAKDAENRWKNLLYEQELELCSRQAAEREAQNQEIRRVRHDMLHHFISLLGMVQAGQTQEATLYIEETLIKSTVCTVQDTSHSGNIVVDALVNYKSTLARVAGIGFSANVFIPVSLPFKSGHLTIILGNLLDNALEACRQAREAERFIELTASYEKGLLFLMVRNTYHGERQRDSRGRFLTTKNDGNRHGIGLASVEQALIPYHGEMVAECDRDIFQVTVVLYGDG